MNHIFQYHNGEAVHPVIKNFEDFQKIQNHVGPGLTAKEIVEKISKLQETGGSFLMFNLNIKQGILLQGLKFIMVKSSVSINQ